MRFLFEIASLAVMALGNDSEMSFIQSTLNSMQRDQESVLRSNDALDQQTLTSDAQLARIVHADIPFSLLEIKSGFDSFSDSSDEGSLLFQSQPTGPLSALQAAKARAAESEKKFTAAMKKLEADKEALLKDQSMRRARAAQERRHLHI